MSKALLAVAVLAVLFLAGCRSEAQNPAADAGPERRMTDDLGRRVKLPERVERAVSLAPNLTEIVFAVGAGDRLVGRTSFDNYPPEAERVPTVGDTMNPNIESIIAAKPQVVLVSTASQIETFTKTLESQGITVFVTNPTSLEEIYQSIEKIGQIFDRKGKAAELVDDLKKRVAAVAGKSRGASPVRVFVQIDKASLYTVGRDSFITDLVEKAGGVSVTNDVETAYPKISKETALALKPEAMILSESPGNDEPNEIFKNSPAVREGRVYKIDADILSRPGPRVVDALEQIAEALGSGRKQ